MRARRRRSRPTPRPSPTPPRQARPGVGSGSGSGRSLCPSSRTPPPAPVAGFGRVGPWNSRSRRRWRVESNPKPRAHGRGGEAGGGAWASSVQLPRASSLHCGRSDQVPRAGRESGSLQRAPAETRCRMAVELTWSPASASTIGLGDRAVRVRVGSFLVISTIGLGSCRDDDERLEPACSVLGSV